MIIGADISTLIETESLGGRFFDAQNEGALIPILKNYGVESVRIRLWVDPFDEKGISYGGGGCDINTALTTAKRAKAEGMSIMLDFHYSDFWTDPSRQLIPKAWRGKELKELCETVHNYTKEVLGIFKTNGVYPDYVQTGNEITGGTLWPIGKITYDENLKKRVGYGNLAKLLKSAVSAVRQSGNAKILLHLERSGDNECYRDWFDNIIAAGVDFDIIGVSYYPFWHGDFNALCANLDDISVRYKKDIMIVETSYAFTSKHFSAEEGAALVINDSLTLPNGGAKPFPLTEEGQAAFIRELFKRAAGIKGGRCKAVYYWEPAWLPLKGSTWASEGARKYIAEEHKKGGNEWANQCLFDYSGNALPALKEFKKVKERI